VSGLPNGPLNWDEEFSTRTEEQRLCESARLADLIKLDFVEKSPLVSIVNSDGIRVAHACAKTCDVEISIRTKDQSLRTIEPPHAAFIINKDIFEPQSIRIKSQHLPTGCGRESGNVGYVEETVRSNNHAAGMEWSSKACRRSEFAKKIPISCKRQDRTRRTRIVRDELRNVNDSVL
jgi:hypothetical protein